MGLDPTLIGSAVDAGMNAIKLGEGIVQNAKANKMAKELVPLNYNIPQETTDAYQLSERNASQGLSDRARSVLDNQADRGLTTGVDAMLRGGYGVNNFGDLYNNYADHADNIAKLDEELRLKNQDMYYREASNMADARDKQWQINVYKPHEDKAAYIAGLRGQGFQNINNGLDGIGGAAINYATGKLYETDGNPKQNFRSHIDSVDNSTSLNTSRVTPNISTNRVNYNSIFSRAAGLPDDHS